MKIRLKEARNKRNLTLRDLEQMSNVSKSELSNIETGKVIPRLDIFCKICKSLKIPCHCELCDCDDENDNHI